MNLWIYIIIFSVIYGVAVAFDKVGLLPDFISSLKDIVSWVMTITVAKGLEYVNKKVDVDKTPADSKRIKKYVTGSVRL